MMDIKHIPSLEYLTCVKISIAITSNPDVTNLAFVPKSYYSYIAETVFVKSIKKISALKLPRECNYNIRHITMNMIQELVIWSQYHSNIMNHSRMSVNYLCWTPLGSIDELKTARKLFNGLDLNIRSRFWLACEYCFFYDASTIWEAMSEEERRRSNKHTILGRWFHSHRNRGTEPQIDAWNDELLHLFMTYIESQLEKCNIHVFRFILEKKTPVERARILRTVALSNDTSRDLRHFCFQQLNEDTQQEVLEKFPIEVLRYFFKWPPQYCLLHLVNRIWDKISPEDFCDFVEQVLINLRGFFWQNFAIVEILQQLWRRSPANFKDHANKGSFSELLKILLNCSCIQSLRSEVLENAFINGMCLRLLRFSGISS